MRRFVLTALLLAAPIAGADPYIVELAPGAKTSALQKRARRTFRMTMNAVAIDLDGAEVKAMRASPYVVGIHEDHRIAPFPAATTAGATDFVDARARVRASALPARGEGITIAVIDSGIDWTHPALGGGFGHGFKVAGGYDFTNDDPLPEDVEGHGTHVAGIIAADSGQISGVAPAATLLAYKVVHHNGDGRESSVVAALEKCIDPNGDGDPRDHVDVVNISLGWNSGPDSVAARAVDAAVAAGVIVVVAAGNEGSQLGSIMAPGLAPQAITVANARTDTDASPDSSRGPTPGTLLFKPDVAAPGTAIVSTFRNGGFATFSGTSMASPHVAGVAALLRELHPTWTPAEVKSAMLGTARAMNGAPYARGGGNVDAAAADQAKLFVDGGVALGVAGATQGTFEATRTFTVTSRSAQAMPIDATAEGTPSGVSVTVTPGSFSLEPGQSRVVTLRMTANNPAWTIPNDLLAGGAIRLQSGATTARVPWGVVRGARALLTYDGVLTTILADSPGSFALFRQWAPGVAELYVPPGKLWDILVASEDARVLGAEQVALNGDVTIALRAADATRVFPLDGRAQDGTPLVDLPRDGARRHTVALFTTIRGAAADVLPLGDARAIRLGPLSNRIRLAPLESYLDLETPRVHALMHRELTGDGSPLTIVNAERARVRWTADDRVDASADIRYPGGADGLSMVRIDAVSGSIANGAFVDIFLTRELTLNASATITLRGERIALSTMSATRGRIVTELGSPITEKPVEGDVADGPAFPLAFFGTSPAREGVEYLSGFFGGMRELIRPPGATEWRLSDENGKEKMSGSVADPAAGPKLPIAPRDRFHAENRSLHVGGQPAVGELDVVFGSQPADLTAPTITSLRVEHGTDLRLAIADLSFPEVAARNLPAEGVRVSWRPHGTESWHDLQPVVLNEEDGSLLTLGHVPAGTIFRVDLAGPMAMEGCIDLRIEARDDVGNTVSWKQSPSILASGSAPPRRRRPVSR